MGELFDCTDLDTKLIEAHYNRAISYLSLGELELATKAAQTALMINQDYPPALSILDLIKQEYWTKGLTSIKENKIDRGIFAFQCAVNIDPTFTDAYFQLACLYLKKNELEAAEKTAKKILRLNSRSMSAHELLEQITEAYCIRGRVALKRSRLMGAKAAVDEALRLDSNYDPAHELMEQIKWSYYNQGVTFLEQNQYNKASVSFEDALAIDSYFTEAHCGIVRTYLDQGELSSAEKTIRERFDLTSTCARDFLDEIKDAYYDFGVLCLEQGKFANAKKTIKEALRFDSSGELVLKIKDMYCKQGQVYLNGGEYDFARKTVEDALHFDSNYEPTHKLSEEIKHAYCDSGFNFLRRRWYNKATISFENALTMDSDFAKAHCGIACVWIGRGKYTGVEKVIDQVLRLDPISPYLEEIKHAYYKRGGMYLTQGKLMDAEQAANEVLSFDSNYKPIHDLLEKIKHAYYDQGRVYFKQAEFTHAEKAAGEAFRLDPNYKPARGLLEEIKHIYDAQGYILLNVKRGREAKFYFQRAAAIDVSLTEAGFVKAYYWLGCFYLERDELEKAYAAIVEVIQHDSSYEAAFAILIKIKDAYYDRGTAFLNKNQCDKAIACFQKLLVIDANFTEAHCGIALAYLRQGKLDAVKKVVDEAWCRDSSYESAHEFWEEIRHTDYARGLKLLNTNQYEEAITCFENLLVVEDNFAEAYCGLSRAYLGQDELASAEEVVREIARFKSNHEYESACAILEDIKQSYYDRAITCLNEHQYIEAITDFENAVAVDMNFTQANPELQDAYLGFGSVYFEQWDTTEEWTEENDMVERFSERTDFPNLTTQFAIVAECLAEETKFTDEDFYRLAQLPSYVVAKLNKFDDAYAALCQELRREPRGDEIAEALDLTESDVEVILMYGVNTISTDFLLNAKRSTETLSDLIKDSTTSGGEGAIIEIINENLIFQYLKRLPDIRDLPDQEENRLINEMINGNLIFECIEELPTIEREVLKMLFGFEGGKRKTLQEISIALRMPKKQIRQLEKEAIRWLRVLYEEVEEFQSVWF